MKNEAGGSRARAIGHLAFLADAVRLTALRFLTGPADRVSEGGAHSGSPLA